MSNVKLSDFQVKAVKKFIGEDGYGFNANLYRGSKKVAFVVDTANGGPVDIQWCDWKKERVKINNNGHEFSGTPEQKLFLDALNTEKPKTVIEFTQGKPEDFFYTDETWVAKMVDEYEIKKSCKKKTLFVVKENGRDVTYSMKTPFNEEIKDYIKNEYKDNLVEIINERFVA